MTFQALLATKAGEASIVQLHEADLMPGDVVVAVDYSTVNYKDALAITGLAAVIRQFPLIPRNEFAGNVEASAHPHITEGDRDVPKGRGVSHSHHGG